MSKAFDTSVDELRRVWAASDHFDSKVLTFTGLVGAAFALIAGQLHRMPGLPVCAAVLVWVALLSLGAFAVLALSATFWIRGAGAVNPQQIAEHPEFLKDDELFEAKASKSLGEAFARSLAQHQRKTARFKVAQLVLVAAGFSFGAGLMVWYIQASRPQPALTSTRVHAVPDTTAVREGVQR
jgi:hypothetical protein